MANEVAEIKFQAAEKTREERGREGLIFSGARKETRSERENERKSRGRLFRLFEDPRYVNWREGWRTRRSFQQGFQGWRGACVYLGVVGRSTGCIRGLPVESTPAIIIINPFSRIPPGYTPVLLSLIVRHHLAPCSSRKRRNKGGKLESEYRVENIEKRGTERSFSLSGRKRKKRACSNGLDRFSLSLYPLEPR